MSAPQDRKRDEQINVRLSVQERELLDALITETGEGHSVLVRRWIRREHKRLCKP